jgi:GNAT superfamily N-acetyltransferase
VEVKIRPVTDLADLRAFHAITSAAHAHDYVSLPAEPFATLLPRLTQPQTRADRVERFLGLEDDVPVGLMDLQLPLLDNVVSAHLDVIVHPDHRGRGHGQALLERGLAEGQRQARSRFYLESSVEPAQRLLTKAGALPAQQAVRRRLDLTAPLHPPSPVPDGYRLVHYRDRAPEDAVDGVAHLQGRMSTDAPVGELGTEPELWDADRLREREDNLLAERRAAVSTAVVHIATNYVAGITDLIVNRDDPTCVDQWATIVDPDHRGRRLGVVLKSWNHPALLEHWPSAAFINTWNAESNTYMVCVNEALGFEVMERWTEWQLDV